MALNLTMEEKFFKLSVRRAYLFLKHYDQEKYEKLLEDTATKYYEIHKAQKRITRLKADVKILKHEANKVIYILFTYSV